MPDILQNITHSYSQGYPGPEICTETSKENDLLHRPKNERNQKEIAEAELDIFHAKMNRYMNEEAD